MAVFFLQEPLPLQLAALVVVSVLYGLYRHQFSALPLQRDTGFYVPNYSVIHRRFGPFRGWNTYFSGASRIIPQFVHTWIYLLSSGPTYGPTFRSFYSVLTLFTGVLVGITASFFVQEAWAGWCAFLLYILIAGESQYGPYFESAEIFQVCLQVAGFLLVLIGLQHQSPWLATLGISLCWLDTLTVKLTGGALAVCLSAAVFLLHRDWWLTLAIPAALAPVLYIGWVRLSGRSLKDNFHYLKQHEIHVRRHYRNPIFLFVVKGAWVGKLVAYNPFIPLLAAPGAYFFFSETPPTAPVFVCLSAYLLGSLVAYFKQGHRVLYFVFPFLPAVSLLGVVAVAALAERYSPGLALGLAAAAGLLSVVVNLRQKINQTPDEFNRRVWSTHNRPGGRIGDMMASGNTRLTQFADRIRPRVRGSSLLVIGSFNQASVLLEAGYDTPLVSLCILTKGLVGDAKPWLEAQLAASPPDYLVDTGNEYAAYAGELPALKPYRVIEEAFGMSLYQRG